MLASSRKTCAAAMPHGGRNRPPYIAAINRCQPANASHPSGPPAGLVPAQKDTRKARCRTPPSPGATLPVCGARIALRVLKHTCVLRPLRCREAVKTGAVSEGRSYAFYRRTGDNKRSDGRLLHEKQLSPPQAALDSAAPCRGGFIGGSPPKASPVRGDGCAARSRRRGTLPVCGGDIRQGPAGPCPASVGDDARIVPENLRCRNAPRRAKSPALHCGHKQVPARKRQPSVRPAGGPGASPEGYSQGKVLHPSVG